jgi:hypothetical protein
MNLSKKPSLSSIPRTFLKNQSFSERNAKKNPSNTLILTSVLTPAETPKNSPSFQEKTL